MNSNQEAANKLFEGIYNFVAPMPEGTQKQLSFYTQLRCGIDVSEFNEKEGSLLADEIPLVQRDLVASGRNVSEVYPKILSASLPEDNPPEDKKKAFEAAKELVAGSGYDEYKKAKRTCDRAYLKYCRLKNDSSAAQEDVMEAKMDWDDAQEDFIRAGKNEMEAALATIDAYERYTPQAVFHKAAQVFDQAGTQKQVKGYYETDFIPRDWTKADKLAWESITIQSSEQTFRVDNDCQKTDFSRSSDYSKGWWFWRHHDKVTEEQHKKLETANSRMDTSDLSLSMEVAVVQISRPWFNGSLLSYSQAFLQNEDAGAICSGTLLGNGALQLLPTAFVLVRNVSIYNQFSKEEKSLIQTVIDNKADSLSFGPFCTTRKSHTAFHEEISKSEQNKYGNVQCLTLGENPQLIGVVSSIMSPQFPAVSGK
jgi:hypothetical protein